MGRLEMLTQSFAMVSHDDDEGGRRDGFQDFAHERVGVGDFRGVAVCAVAARERLGSEVGEMGIVEMDPREKGLPFVAEPVVTTLIFMVNVAWALAALR